MTIHQAKGLEFKSVFLFACHEKASSSNIKSKTFSINKEFGLLCKVPVDNNFFNKYQSSPIVNLAEYISYRKNMAEIKRLFYVAITRAKNYLCICATNSNADSFPEESFFGQLGSCLDLDLNSNKHEISNNLKYLKVINNKFITEEASISFDIPIIKHLETQIPNQDILLVNAPPSNINIESILDSVSCEIISASKYAIFKQCPAKYQLTYSYGYQPIHKKSKDWVFSHHRNITDDFKQRENEITENDTENSFTKSSYSNVKGIIIHSLLENETTLEDLKHKIEIQIDRNNEILQGDRNDLGNEIFTDLNNYYNSYLYKKITSFKNYKNEFQVYLYEKDYFLFGIIDRIVFDDDKIRIIDYKTDLVDEDSARVKSEHYFNQLKFYAYIISKTYKHVEKYELQLVFIKNPNLEFKHTLLINDIELIGGDISQVVEQIRKKDFQKNINNCKECYFSINFSSCVL
jgi:ATP-dependent helicase/nuclease subunit A